MVGVVVAVPALVVGAEALKARRLLGVRAQLRVRPRGRLRRAAVVAVAALQTASGSPPGC